EEDLRSALRFEVQELIPIPVEEAILDFQVLEEFMGPEGEPMIRILLVAAQRDMVRSLIAALEGAGLSASLIDLVPFALMRSLAGNDLGLATEGPVAEAIVSVGSGVTNVVGHGRGVPRFVRILVTGGYGITEAIAAELEIDTDQAEDLKRRADVTSAFAPEARAGEVVAERLTPLLEEIRGSIDYYQAQADAAPIARVLLTGGSSRLPNLGERLGEMIGIPVEQG